MLDFVSSLEVISCMETSRVEKVTLCFGLSLRNKACNLSKVINRVKRKSYLSLGIKEEVTRHNHYREKNVHWAS